MAPTSRAGDMATPRSRSARFSSTPATDRAADIIAMTTIPSSLIDPIQTIVDVFKVDKFRPHIGNIDRPLAGELDQLVDVLIIAAMTAGEFNRSDHEINVRDGESFGVIADQRHPPARLQ